MTERRDDPVEDLLPNLVLPSDGEDHCLGTASSRYALVEYGDFESPHCAHVNSIVHELVRELGEDLCFVFRNYPLASEHPNAVHAAEAAEAADMQGKYWMMHDRLFQHQHELSEALIRRLARELPLDMATFDRDLKSGAPAGRVVRDRDGGLAVGVEATPTFFVNGRMHVGSYEFLPLLGALRAPYGTER